MSIPIPEHEDELDILLRQAIREIDEFDAVSEHKGGALTNQNFPISPESLSPVSLFGEEEEQQQQQQHITNTESMSTLLRFFSNLKTNYLKLCNSYNFLLLKLSDCEMDRCKLYEENLELKKLLKYMIDVNNKGNNTSIIDKGNY